MMRLLPSIVAFFCGLVPGLSSGHEFWVEPLSYQVDPDDEMVANIRNGQNFDGSNLAWFDRHVARAEAVFAGTTVTYSGRTGDRPALTTTALGPGLGILLHETTPSKISYKTWEKFQKFVDHKDLGIEKSAHLAAGHPETGFSESYTRHAKALIAIGPGSGTDQAFGLETEIVALSNPYDATFNNNMQIALFYQDAPRPNAQIEIFDRAPDGTVSVSLAQTDASGKASIPVNPGHTYLLDAVLIRPSTREGSIYDTLWAALTFFVPLP